MRPPGNNASVSGVLIEFRSGTRHPRIQPGSERHSAEADARVLPRFSMIRRSPRLAAWCMECVPIRVVSLSRVIT